MANENKVIKSLNAQNYSGNYEVVSGEWNVAGSLNTDGQKQLTNISGIVKKGEGTVLSFSAWGGSNNLRYSFSDVADLEGLPAAIEIVINVISEVKGELENKGE